MDIDTLGTERLRLLYDAGLVRDVADLYDLQRHQLVGLGADTAASIQEKGADNILRAIEASKQVPFERVLFALGIRYVGEVGAKKLARYFGNIDSLMAAGSMELAMVEDVGDVTAMAVYDYFASPAHRAVVDRLRAAGLQMQVVEHRVSNRLEGMTIVVSGVFEHFSRDEIKASIEQHGGKAAGSISGKTTYLLAGAKMGPEKLRKAEKLGVPILSEEEYIRLIEN